MNEDFSIAIPLARFLTIETCPPDWKPFNLYLIRDEQVVFYVGQSQCAFERVWEHLRGGVHGHAIVGRFVLVNWPKSAKFTVMLMSSRAPRFAPVSWDLDTAERALIEQYAPCFNIALNRQPAPLPEAYLPPNAPIKQLKNFRRMLREASYAARHLSEPANTDWES